MSVFPFKAIFLSPLSFISLRDPFLCSFFIWPGDHKIKPQSNLSIRQLHVSVCLTALGPCFDRFSWLSVWSISFIYSSSKVLFLYFWQHSSMRIIYILIAIQYVTICCTQMEQWVLLSSDGDRLPGGLWFQSADQRDQPFCVRFILPVRAWFLSEYSGFLLGQVVILRCEWKHKCDEPATGPGGTASLALGISTSPNQLNGWMNESMLLISISLLQGCNNIMGMLILQFSLQSGWSVCVVLAFCCAPLREHF